jgi:hypothetical protein
MSIVALLTHKSLGDCFFMPLKMAVPIQVGNFLFEIVFYGFDS